MDDDKAKRKIEQERTQRLNAIQKLVSTSGKCYGRSVTENLKVVNEEVINTKLIVSVVEYICRSFDPDSGAILIFLPGLAEIRDAMNSLKSSSLIGKKNNYLLLPLHSSLSSAEQVSIDLTT